MAKEKTLNTLATGNHSICIQSSSIKASEDKFRDPATSRSPWPLTIFPVFGKYLELIPQVEIYVQKEHHRGSNHQHRNIPYIKDVKEEKKLFYSSFYTKHQKLKKNLPPVVSLRRYVKGGLSAINAFQSNHQHRNIPYIKDVKEEKKLFYSSFYTKHQKLKKNLPPVVSLRRYVKGGLSAINAFQGSRLLEANRALEEERAAAMGFDGLVGVEGDRVEMSSLNALVINDMIDKLALSSRDPYKIDKNSHRNQQVALEMIGIAATGIGRSGGLYGAERRGLGSGGVQLSQWVRWSAAESMGRETQATSSAELRSLRMGERQQTMGFAVGFGWKWTKVAETDWWIRLSCVETVGSLKSSEEGIFSSLAAVFAIVLLQNSEELLLPLYWVEGGEVRGLSKTLETFEDRFLAVKGSSPSSNIFGNCHLNTATLYLRTCRRLLSARTSVADPVARRCNVVVCLLIQTLWHSSFVDNIFAEDFVCLLVIDSCINPLVLSRVRVLKFPRSLIRAVTRYVLRFRLEEEDEVEGEEEEEERERKWEGMVGNLKGGRKKKKNGEKEGEERKKKKNGGRGMEEEEEEGRGGGEIYLGSLEGAWRELGGGLEAWEPNGAKGEGLLT
ncbi:hypothetical protein M5K25_005841 [Dendrobium thyrsiflorum]|uniref:Uncharacterized protein n=1 Tax=Dendrobium thyrsiflorum TaxID=117978 RepID=A0ABD0VGX6_DENTH